MFSGSGFLIRQYAYDIALSNHGKEVKLLSERELCKIYDVSRPTVRKALDELVDEGYLVIRKGLGADGIYTGDACASCSFYSPETYRTMFFERQKKSIEFVHANGMKALLHICGKIGMILEDMVATGADVIESLDAFSAGGDIELKDAKRRVGSQICLIRKY